MPPHKRRRPPPSPARSAGVDDEPTRLKARGEARDNATRAHARYRAAAAGALALAALASAMRPGPVDRRLYYSRCNVGTVRAHPHTAVSSSKSKRDSFTSSSSWSQFRRHSARRLEGGRQLRSPQSISCSNSASDSESLAGSIAQCGSRGSIVWPGVPAGLLQRRPCRRRATDATAPTHGVVRFKHVGRGALARFPSAPSDGGSTLPATPRRAAASPAVNRRALPRSESSSSSSESMIRAYGPREGEAGA